MDKNKEWGEGSPSVIVPPTWSVSFQLIRLYKLDIALARLLQKLHILHLIYLRMGPLNMNIQIAHYLLIKC